MVPFSRRNGAVARAEGPRHRARPALVDGVGKREAGTVRPFGRGGVSMAETRVLVVYATSEGHSALVAERIAEALRRTVDVVDLRLAAQAPDPSGYDAVVAGGPIHASH